MITRYSRKEISDLWSEENKFRIWLDIEIAVCEAWAHYGEIPEDSLKVIKEKANFDIDRINELEKELKHDVVAFLTSVSEFVGDDSRFIHLGMTSSDILDTALAIQLRDSGQIILRDLENVVAILKNKAFNYKKTPMIGRSHGIHAEPKTLGLVFALWYDEMQRNITRFRNAIKNISVGMMSGAVGTYANIDPKIESYACKKLGLEPAKITTQIIHRDIHAEYFLLLALIASSIERIATEIRHFQRTEVLEMEEPFSKGQKGSSAMPHKRNPILSENLCGLARVVRASSVASLENISLWHERDISHSSVERIIAPDNTILIDFMLNRLIALLDGLQIYEDNLSKNIWLTNGLVFSQKVLLKLINKGVTREEAYSFVQRNAMRCWKEKVDFSKLLKEDEQVSNILSESEIDSCFDVALDFKNIDTIFDKVFN